MNTKPRVKKIIAFLKNKFPRVKIELSYSNPLELLVATILSAQCTDKRVNIVTAKLFKKYKTLKNYADADINEFERDIRSTGFYHNKAKNIINSAKIILKIHNGKVPNTMNDILKLPGVARKTANIVLGNAYGIIEGIAVDTHVKRISIRLGLSSNTDPVKIEQDLMRIVPKENWLEFSYLLQNLGRAECVARGPKHLNCILREICPSNSETKCILK